MKKPIITSLIVLSTLLFGCIDLGDLKYQNLPNELTQTETEGINRQIIQIPHPDSTKSHNLEFHIYSIDPSQINFFIHQSTDKSTASSISKTHITQNSLFTFNGSFFDENFKPLGLLISNSQEISPYRPSELSKGIFTISKNSIPKLLTEKPNQTILSDIQFAIQNGPILVNENGEPTFNKETGNYAARTAIGITKTNQVLIIIIPQSLSKINNEITLFQFSKILTSNPIFTDLGLHSVLNLDGGVSTGYKSQTHFEPELNQIQNIIYTKPKI